MEIKRQVINILEMKETFGGDTKVSCELYAIFDELSIECFGNEPMKQLLCYDQLCIYLDSITDNMCRVSNMTSLTCTIYESGLCDITFHEI